MTYSPAQAVANARADVGYREGWNNYNKFSEWQYGNPYNPWCDSAVCKWSWDAGYRFPANSGSGERGDYNVTTHRIHSMEEGTWRNRGYRASPGDLVPLAFTEPDQHIEMVIADNGGDRIATIGGNTGNAVLYRTRYRNNVVGFIALTQSVQVGAGTTVEPAELLDTPTPTPYLDLEDDDMVIVVTDGKPAMLISGGKACLIRDGQTVLRMAEAKVGVANHISAHDYNSFLEAFNAHR